MLKLYGIEDFIGSCDNETMGMLIAKLNAYLNESNEEVEMNEFASSIWKIIKIAKKEELKKARLYRRKLRKEKKYEQE